MEPVLDPFFRRLLGFFVRFALLVAALHLVGCQTAKTLPEDFIKARFTLETHSADTYAALVTLPVSQVRIRVLSESILSEYDYASIELAKLELGNCLLFTLKPAAARELYRISVGNQGKRLVLLLNGQPMGVRRIDGPIADGRVYVFVEAADEALEEIAKDLGKTNIEIQKRLSR